MKHLILPALLATMLVSGCTAGATAGVGASAGTNNGTGATPATGGNNALNPATMFVAGRKWEYTSVSKAAGQATDGLFTLECTEVKGDTATIKSSVTVMGQTSSSTSTVKINGDGNSFTSINTKSGASATPVLSGTKAESVTVPAGTFNATRYTYTTSDSQADSTTDQWIADGVGMVKMVSMIKPKAAGIPGMPAGMDLSSTSTMELKSYTK